MKKLTCCLLAILMLAGCSCVLSSCLLAVKKEPVKVGYTLPDGYQFYDDGYISFAYPSDWQTTNGSTVILKGTKNNNNITIVHEPATELYESWGPDDARNAYGPAYESIGGVISGITVKQGEKDGMHVTEISFRTTLNGVSMTQKAYVVTISDRTYTVTVTEVVSDSALCANVYESLTARK